LCAFFRSVQIRRLIEGQANTGDPNTKSHRERCAR
jgi:hypothetical protein